MLLVLGTLLWSVRPRSQSSISRTNGDRRSQIEKHVVVSVRSNLPQKSSTVLSEPKFGPPNKKFLDPPLVTRHVCIHVGVIPSEGRKKKAGETTYTEKVQQRILFYVKCCCCFYLPAFHISGTTPEHIFTTNQQWFTFLKLRGQTGWGEDKPFIKVQREWLLSIAISR